MATVKEQILSKLNESQVDTKDLNENKESDRKKLNDLNKNNLGNLAIQLDGKVHPKMYWIDNDASMISKDGSNAVITVDDPDGSNYQRITIRVNLAALKKAVSKL